jgi:hypothetical protein
MFPCIDVGLDRSSLPLDLASLSRLALTFVDNARFAIPFYFPQQNLMDFVVVDNYPHHTPWSYPGGAFAALSAAPFALHAQVFVFDGCSDNGNAATSDMFKEKPKKLRRRQ